MKIYHGPKSWNQTDEKNAKAERRLGLKSKCYSYMDLLKNPFRLINVLFTSKVFNFYSAYTFFPISTNHPVLFSYFFGLDLFLLAIFKKKIVLHFQGCELRNRYAEVEPKVCDYCAKKDVYCKRSVADSRRSAIKRHFKRVDAVCVTTPDLLNYVDHENKHWIPKVMEISESYTKVFSDKKNVIKVFHATTDRTKKGTEKIMEVINKYPEKFELVFAEGKPREEIMRLAKQCDLVIDQLYIGWYGNFSVEMMALGLPVLVNISEDLEQHIKENNIPIINVSENTLENVLLAMYDNQDDFSEIGKKSKLFASKFHSEEEIGLRLKKVYKSIGLQI